MDQPNEEGEKYTDDQRGTLACELFRTVPSFLILSEEEHEYETCCDDKCGSDLCVRIGGICCQRAAGRRHVWQEPVMSAEVGQMLQAGPLLQAGALLQASSSVPPSFKLLRSLLSAG